MLAASISVYVNHVKRVTPKTQRAHSGALDAAECLRPADEKKLLNKIRRKQALRSGSVACVCEGFVRAVEVNQSEKNKINQLGKLLLVISSSIPNAVHAVIFYELRSWDRIRPLMASYYATVCT